MMTADTTPPPMRDDEALAAEYALGTLPVDERTAFEARLRDDADLRSLVAQWEQVLLPFADEIEPVEPPARVYSALEEQLFTSSSASAQPGWLNSLALWRGLAGLGFAAALVLAVMVYQPPLEGPQSALVTQLSNESGTLQIAALYDRQAQRLILTHHAGQPEEGRDFELWFIVADGAPVSLGTLALSSRMEIELPAGLAGRIESTSSFAISDEPVGGSPTGAPTGDVVAVGQLALLQI